MKQITVNEYIAITNNCLHNYNKIYDNANYGYFEFFDIDEFECDIHDMQLNDISYDDIEKFINSADDKNNKFMYFKHKFNFQRFALDTSHSYYDDLFKLCQHGITFNNHSFSFTDDYTEFSDENTDTDVYVKCITSFVYTGLNDELNWYKNNYIHICEVYCKRLSNVVPVYKFIIFETRNVYVPHYTVYSKNIDIDNINAMTGYNIKAQNQLIADIELLENQLDTLQNDLINYNK